MIEAWWRSLKHQWLFLNSLDTIDTVRKLVHFYVSEHNSVMPHSAFSGQTPDEMYFATKSDIAEELRRKCDDAREKRFNANRSLTCGVCDDAESEAAAI